MPDFLLTEILLAIHVPFGTGERLHPNRPAHGLALTVSGECVYRFSTGAALTAGPGDCVFLPQGSSYTVDFTRPTARDFVYAVNFRLAAAPDTGPFRVHLRDPEPTLARFQSVVQSWKTKRPGYRESALGDVYKILAALKAEQAAAYAGGPLKARIAPALTAIAEGYTSPGLTDETLAAACGISVTYLRRLFLRATGLSPSETLRRARLTYARELLSSSEFSVAEIAERAGFSDPAYFSRDFKKSTGLSPRAWAEQQKAQSN